jgi:hypothetical protein
MVKVPPPDICDRDNGYHAIAASVPDSIFAGNALIHMNIPIGLQVGIRWQVSD